VPDGHPESGGRRQGRTAPLSGKLGVHLSRSVQKSLNGLGESGKEIENKTDVFSRFH
jgi:hypothetical protein